MYKMYYYGCKSHNTDFGAVPVKGILMWRPSKDDKYYRTLVYSRKLTKKEMDEFELDYIKGPNEMVISVDTSSLSPEDITIPRSEMSVSITQASQDAPQGPETLHR